MFFYIQNKWQKVPHLELYYYFLSLIHKNLFCYLLYPPLSNNYYNEAVRPPFSSSLRTDKINSNHL